MKSVNNLEYVTLCNSGIIQCYKGQDDLYRLSSMEYYQLDTWLH